ncbi:MAG TPA: choice-of-anchor E domain-containing protein [Flavisolibacter sp.]|nr:choice-of-anchor E domain-containing protein [Flavisolibacter sp.]
MKTTFTLLSMLLLQLFFSANSYAQCVDGSAPTPVMMDTTIKFAAGVTSKVVKFPQFDPEEGMVTCVKLTITMTGVIDTVAMQNLSDASQTANFDYNRTDNMTGPGLTPSLSNSVTKSYGPYSVTAFDGNFSSGTDFKSLPRDTVLNKTVVRTLNDATEISQFYGHDSVSYNYNINVSAVGSMTGGNNSFLVMTSALVRFRFEYCKCSKATLPLGIKNFTAVKASAQTVNLSWDGENDDYNYSYDIEVSRDGKHFSRVATLERKFTANPSYLYSFALANNDFGRYYFRVRQHWLNGYVRYTPIKTMEFVNPLFATTTLYPNPSRGSAGIKFVNVKPGRMLVQISNAEGRQVALKEFTVSQTDYQQLPSLAKGLYWVKMTDLESKTSCIKQLLIQ